MDPENRVDPENKVVRLCVAGMAAEAEGEPARARELFERAWAAAGDDYERCVAAHYVARHQDTPEETLRWNEECLRLADAVGDGRVVGFYASLHLNIAQAHGTLGRDGAAREHFALAAGHVDAVPEGQYREWIRFAIARGLRDQAADGRFAELDALVEGWRERGELTALALVLPALLGDLGELGPPGDGERLVTALRMLHSSGRLPDGERAELGRVIGSLAGGAR
ncbi:hypothetical protein E1265_20450 [Streptomyces sp. 8K308]|uniref:hypothetical protein n=1 Tax=Streptomyces sp. 8K308 TaxID=2530388 RepID=UPI001052EAB3|nr:hypothetical protein [Streptomyces sp. 8K308]TDC20791.1 hypothetical protein E1265_20450 [Streptomyces sp. 8K308]